MDDARGWAHSRRPPRTRPHERNALLGTKRQPTAPATHPPCLQGHDAAELIDLFLFANVASCFFFTDIANNFGLRKVRPADYCPAAVAKLPAPSIEAKRDDSGLGDHARRLTPSPPLSLLE